MEFQGLIVQIKGIVKWLKDYYQEMIGNTEGSLLFNRTMDYCSKKTGWTINSDTARIFGITTE